MRILLAEPRGFCAGVRMAVDCVERVLQMKGAPIYVLHEIVHNRHVVEDFQSRGVTFVSDMVEVPEGGVIIYSAHGISPAVRAAAKRRHLVEIDATCPLVTKVHLEVQRFAREGYSIIFIGHRAHDEAIGTVGEAPAAITVVESAEEVEALTVRADKIAFVTQTTLSLSDAERVIAALRRKFPHIKSPPKEDICYATSNRQAAVGQLAPEAELVLVIGSANSSNSRRLVETAEAVGKRAFLIDDAGQLKTGWFVGISTVLVTAGASAPEHLVDELLSALTRDYAGEVEERLLVEEDVFFAPPRSLRSLAVVG